MTVRAFACRAPHTGQVLGYVTQSRVDEWPPQTRVLRLRFGSDWRCALLDRSRLAEVEGLLLRDAVASDEQDCPECAAALTASAREPAPEPEAEPGSPAETVPAPTPATPPVNQTPARTVQAAAIAMHGQQMLVVLVRRDLIDSPGEAGLLQGALERQFRGTAVVLMGQDEDGSPHYRGAPELLRLLQGLPVERMPWKAYPAP